MIAGADDWNIFLELTHLMHVVVNASRYIAIGNLR